MELQIPENVKVSMTFLGIMSSLFFQGWKIFTVDSCHSIKAINSKGSFYVKYLRELGVYKLSTYRVFGLE